MPNWTTRNIPDQTGRLVIITGANSGTGYETALELARKGAEVVLAVRDVNRGQGAVKRIQDQVPQARLKVETLDLSNQGSVAAFAERMLAAGSPIHALINNAGVMALPQRQETVDGHEMQWATNYLGHFALTARLRPLLTAGQARVVQLSSIAHRDGRLRFDDLEHASGYKSWAVYGQSKLAMLMFALELDRRSAANGWGLTSVAAHPGWARTELIANGPRSQGASGLYWTVAGLIEPFLSHSAQAGALPILMAATAPDVQGGQYYGATGFNEMKGPPGVVEIRPHALSKPDASRLWTMTEAALGVRFT